MQTRYIVVVTLASSICFFIVMALVTRFLVQKHAKPSTDGSDERGSRQQDQLNTISRSWKQLFVSKQQNNKGHWVPSLSGIVDAGIEGVWSSVLFTHLHGHPGEVSFDQLCDAFATELRSRTPAERSAYSGEIVKFLSSTKRGNGHKRVQSMSYKGTGRGREDAALKSQRKSLDIIASEMGLGRGLSVKKTAPALVSMGNGLGGAKQGAWMKNGYTAEYHDGKPGIKVTAAELAALALVLGTQVTTGSDAAPYKGALGISISVMPTEDGKQQIVLRQHKRKISQMPAGGSGFSPLFAMHMAAGSLPFSQDSKTVDSILITNETFEAVQSGASISWQRSSKQTLQAKILATLPNSRKLNFYTCKASSRPTSSPTLLDAIAALPFSGGLPPLAHTPLINTVRFIAAGGLTPARLLQRLEGLVDKVQLFAPHLAIFGPLHAPENAALLFRERERLGKLATNTDTPDSTADKTARMQRYITLIERLMALVPDMKAHEVRDAVQQATRQALERSYADAVAAHTTSPTSTPMSGSRPQSARTPHGSTRSKRPSRMSMDMSSMHRFSSSFPRFNLGTHAEHLLKTELPLDVEGIAAVARLVIVAWTLSVEPTAWGVEGESESGVKVWDGCDSGEMVFV